MFQFHKQIIMAYIFFTGALKYCVYNIVLRVRGYHAYLGHWVIGHPLLINKYCYLNWYFVTVSVFCLFKWTQYHCLLLYSLPIMSDFYQTCRFINDDAMDIDGTTNSHNRHRIFRPESPSVTPQTSETWVWVCAMSMLNLLITLSPMFHKRQSKK